MPAPYENPYDTPEWGAPPPLNGPPPGPRKQTREEMVLGGAEDPARREQLNSGIAQLQQMLGGAYNPRMASALNIGLRNGRSIPEIMQMFQQQANGNAYANFSANHDGGTAIQNLLSQFGPVQPQNNGPTVGGVPVLGKPVTPPLRANPWDRPIVEYGPGGNPNNVPIGGGRGFRANPWDRPIVEYGPGGNPNNQPTPNDNPGLDPNPKPQGPPGGGGVGPGGQPIGGGPRKQGGYGEFDRSGQQSQQQQPQTITMRYDYRQPSGGQNQQQSRSSQPQQQPQQNNYNRAAGQTNQWNQQQQFAAQRPFEQTAPNRTSPTQEANKASQGYQGWRGNGQGAASRY